MAYVMRYGWSVGYVVANGVGMNSPLEVKGTWGANNGPKLDFFNSGGVGSQTFTTTDIANFVATMQADIIAQLTAQQTRIQGFASGGG